MPDPVITNVDLGSPEWANGEFRPDEITFGGAGTLLAGTILARDSVSGKLIPFVKGGSTNEDGIPKAVLTYDVAAAGAGDEPVRVLVSGEVRKERLIILDDGDASNVDDVVIDQLRDYSIVALDVFDHSRLDNQ